MRKLIVQLTDGTSIKLQGQHIIHPKERDYLVILDDHSQEVSRFMKNKIVHISDEAAMVSDMKDETIQSLSEEAKRRDMSIDMLVLELLREESEQKIYHDLDTLAGTWNREEANEFMKTIADFEQVDEKLWE